MHESRGPGAEFELALASVERYPALVRELEEATGLPLGFRRCGVIDVVEPAEADRRMAWFATRGLHAERLGPEDLARHEPRLAPQAAALRYPDEARVDNRRMARALHLCAARAVPRSLPPRSTILVTAVADGVWVRPTGPPRRSGCSLRRKRRPAPG
jgi:glycine/D-amino acid oxidase-like deaminating enzyme